MSLPYRFKVVRDADAADFNSLRVTLFRFQRKICAWYIGPARAGLIRRGYLPASDRVIACSAVVRALTLAEQAGLDVCIIDPDGLWQEAWIAA